MPGLEVHVGKVLTQTARISIKETKTPKVVMHPARDQSTPQKGGTKNNVLKRPCVGSTQVGKRARPGSTRVKGAHATTKHEVVVGTEVDTGNSHVCTGASKGLQSRDWQVVWVIICQNKENTACTTQAEVQITSRRVSTEQIQDHLYIVVRAKIVV